MTTELWCLVVNALWGFGLIMLEVMGKTKAAGPVWNAGNRDEAPVFPAWVQRTSRALANHKENFPLFAVAVLVVHIAGKEDRLSAVAAAVYVVARILHGLLYMGGVTKVRTLAYLVAMGAVFTVLSRLCS